MFRDKDKFRVAWREKGKRYSRNFSSKEEARDFERKLKAGVLGSVTVTKQNPLMEDFFERWLNEYSKVEKGDNSNDEDRRVIERHLKPAFRCRPLNSIGKGDLVEMKSKLLRTKAHQKETFLSPKTVNNILLIAKSVMSFAVDLELIPQNPWLSVKLCKLPERDFRYWSFKERNEFFEKARNVKPDLADLVMLAAMTGLRRGELAALTWNLIDFHRRKAKIKRSYSVRLKKHGPTKGKEIAEVGLNPVAMEILRRRHQNRTDATVFPTKMFQNLRRDFGQLCKDVGARPIRFHDLRHTFASHLTEKAVDQRKVQELLRVKSSAMVQRYAHLHPDHLDGVTDLLCDTRTDTRRRKNRESNLRVSVNA